MPNSEKYFEQKAQHQQAVNQLCQVCMGDEAPPGEKVVQFYACRFYDPNSRFTKFRNGGKLFITENYLFFHADNCKHNISIPFVQVAQICPKRSKLTKAFKTVIEIKLKDATGLEFTGFYHRDTVVALADHLLHHTPSFFALPSLPSASSPSEPSVAEVNVPEESNAKAKGGLFGRWSDADRDLRHNPSAPVYEQPDVRVAEQCNKLLDEVIEIQVETRDTLARQAHSLDRTQRNVEETLVNVRRGANEASAIGSVPGMVKGAVKNAFVSDLGSFQPQDHTWDINDEVEFVVPIVMKKKTFSRYKSALMRFRSSDIVFDLILEDQTTRSLPKLTVLYEEISSVEVDARPYHISIK